MRPTTPAGARHSTDMRFQIKSELVHICDVAVQSPLFWAFLNRDNSLLVFPVSLGGMSTYAQTLEFIRELEQVFSPEVLEVARSEVESLSILIIYDADSRGMDGTTAVFLEKFSELYSLDTDVSNGWIKVRDHDISLFVFTDAGGKYGVLEDSLLELFRKKASPYIDDIVGHFNQHFEPIAENGDRVAYEAKKKKAILTTCGQLESQIAGAALTVVVRDTNLLDGVFDFTEAHSTHSRLLKRIESV